MEDAKIKFEKERETTLKSLPDSVKSMFGHIGFAILDEEDALQVPVLILNPYHVPPKPVRDIYWFDLFMGKKRKKGGLIKLAYLVYHYGSNDPDDCYSFVEQDEFTSYEAGCEAGYHVLPSHVQAKLDAGQPLEESDEHLVRSWSEMQEDAAKQPEDRRRGVAFQERYELLAPTKPKDPPRQKKRQKTTK
jgi:hypothetical protein